MKSHGLFLSYSPPIFLSLSLKVFCPCCVGTCLWLAIVPDPELWFSADRSFLGGGGGSLPRLQGPQTLGGFTFWASVSLSVQWECSAGLFGLQ